MTAYSCSECGHVIDREAEYRSIEKDLFEALEGTHRYGGDVAEIYDYRLRRAYPGYGSFRGAPLYVACRLFADEHDATIEIQVCPRNEPKAWRELGTWVIGEKNDHRWHLRVRPRRPR